MSDSGAEEVMSKPCFEDEQGETIKRFVDEEESEILKWHYDEK